MKKDMEQFNYLKSISRMEVWP